MFATADSLLTWKEWIAILTRNFDLDVEKLHRREYCRYDVIDGIALLTFEAVPEGETLPGPTAMTMIDVSPTGFMARGFVEYVRETVAGVELIFADVQRRARARVMHCTSTLGGFKVGFELIFEDGPERR